MSKAKIVLDKVSEVELVINGQRIVISSISSTKKGYSGIVVTAVDSTPYQETVFDKYDRSKNLMSMACLTRSECGSIPGHDLEWHFETAHKLINEALGPCC